MKRLLVYNKLLVLTIVAYCLIIDTSSALPNVRMTTRRTGTDWDDMEEEITDATASALMDTSFFGCNFEDGYCEWSNDTDAEFSWQRNKATTPSKDTGPPWDHTIGRQKGVRGYYVFIEASSPRKNGDRARLVSPAIGKPGTYCLRFWHHMHGSEVKDLNVYIRSVQTSQEKRIAHWSGAWSLENRDQTWVFGKEGDWWNEEYVQFLANEDMQVIFEGVRGENYHGDIALDDISLSVGTCPQKSIDCDFNKNMCGWTQMSGDDFNWLPNRGPTSTTETGPDSDHHLPDQEEGLYLYVEASWPRRDGDKARLRSLPVTCVPGAKPVFLFWYNMNGVDMGPLRVYITSDADIIDFPLWEVNNAQNNDWQLGQIPVPENLIENFMIIIEAERRMYRGDAAIDDVKLIGCDEPAYSYLTLRTQKSPPKSVVTTAQTTTTKAPTTAPVGGFPSNLNCSFEGQSLCGWQQDTDDNFDWTLKRGKTESYATGPKSDRKNSTGWYLYVEASTPRTHGQRATISSEVIPSDIKGCFSFYYHMFGKSMGKLEVMARQAGRGRRFVQKWTREGQQSKNDTDWIQGFVNINETEDFQIVIRGTVGDNLFSDIAIDDLSLSLQPCPQAIQKFDAKSDSMTANSQQGNTQHGVQNSESMVKCSFDRKQLCKWTQETTPFDDFNWKVGSSTLSDLTGPSVDHTTGQPTGVFAYIEASTPQLYGDRAQLKTERITISTKSCFKFWFHMYGSDTGTLSIFKLERRNTEPVLLWSRSGDHGNAWYEGNVNLDRSQGVTIIVEAMRGRGWKSDIAIDDLSLEQGECPQFNCTFNKNFCGWSQRALPDDFSWERQRGPTDSDETGPQEGRNGSYYAYIEASDPRKMKDIARLVSPTVITKKKSSCLTFWYHSYGEHIGKLSVFKKDPNKDESYLGSSEWSISTNEGDQWLFAKITLKTPQPFQVVIEGEIGINYRGDIAIDDIVLTEGKCNECCSTDTFLCGNNFCIPAVERCNDVDDCGDNSDESFCTFCGFSKVPPFMQEIKMNATLQDNLKDLHIRRDPMAGETINPYFESVHDRTNYVEDEIKERRIVAQLTDEEVQKIVHPNLASLHTTGKDEDDPVYENRKMKEVLKVERKRRSVFENISTPLEDPKVKKHNIYYDRSKMYEDDIGDTYNLITLQKMMKLPEEEQTDMVRHFARQQELIKNKVARHHDLSEEQYKAMLPSKRRRDQNFKQDSKLLSRVRRAAILKITGGRSAEYHSHPWQVAYYITSSDGGAYYFCGGTLIHRYWVITAAHCPQLGDLHEIVLGDYDLYKDENEEQEMIVDAVYVHNKYKFSVDLVADIALIKLKYPAISTGAVQAACMLRKDDEQFPAGSPCFTTGWGRIKPDVKGIQQILREASMPIIDRHTCQNNFWSVYEIYDSMVCAGGTGSNSCKGDSGGPLICPKKVKDGYQHYIVGITSWGDTKCMPYVPGVYTRVQSYMRWIVKIMDTDKCHRA